MNTFRRHLYSGVPPWLIEGSLRQRAERRKMVGEALRHFNIRTPEGAVDAWSEQEVDEAVRSIQDYLPVVKVAR